MEHISLNTRLLVTEERYYRNLRDLLQFYRIGQRKSKSMKTVNYKNTVLGKKEKVKG